MDFRGTYTPIHAFREAYAKAKAIGVNLSDSSDSDSSEDIHMPSPVTGSSRAFNLDLATQQRLEKMDTAHEAQTMIAGGSPRGGGSPRPPSSTGIRSSVSRVTAFTPKTFMPMSQATGGRLSTRAEQHVMPKAVARALLSEPSVIAADHGGSTSGEQAGLMGRSRGQQQIAGQQMLVLTDAQSVGSSTKPQQASKDASKTQAGSFPTELPSGRRQDVCHGALPPQQEGNLAGSQPKPSRRLYAESDDWSVLLGQEAVLTAAAVAKAGTISEATTASSSDALGPAQVSFRPAAVPFKPKAVPLQQAEATSSLGPVPSKPAGVPFRPAVLPSEQATAASSFAPLPFKAAEVPFKAATLPPEQTAAGGGSAPVHSKSAVVHFTPPVVPFNPAAVPTEHTQAASIGPTVAPSKALVLPSRAAAEPSHEAHAGSSSTVVPLKSAAVPLRPVTALGKPEDCSSQSASASSSASAAPSVLANVPVRSASLSPQAAEVSTSAAPQSAPIDQKAALPSVAAASEAAPKAAAPTPVRQAATSKLLSEVPTGSKPGLPHVPSAAKANLPVMPPASKAAASAVMQSVLPHAQQSGSSRSQVSVGPDRKPGDAAANTHQMHAIDSQQQSATSCNVAASGTSGGNSLEVLADSALDRLPAQLAARRFPRARNTLVNAIQLRRMRQHSGMEQVDAKSADLMTLGSPSVPRLNLAVVSPGPTPVTSTPITPINVSGSVVPSHKAATVPPSKPPLSPVADPSATPTPRLATTSNAAARTVASYPSTPASTAQTPKVMTPPRHSTTSLGTLVSEHRQRRSVSAKKPPLHPPLSPSVLPSPPAQPITGNQSRSPPTMTQEPLGASEADEADGPGEDIPRRTPLVHRGLTKQQWAALQHQKATQGPRKALRFQYPPGYHPWAPDAQQDDLEAASTAASTVATSAAAPAPVAMPETLTSATPPASLSDGAAISHDQSMLRRVAASKGGESQRRVAGMGQDRALPTTAVQGLPATAPRATPDVPRATEGGHSQVIPPSAGRGSEGGVSTSEPASVTAKLDMGLQPIGKLSALLKRPGKAEVLAGTEDVHSPRAPWEIKASTTANATASLARTYAPTPGMATAAATAQPEQPADDAALRATLSHKSQQRRAQNLAKHRPRGGKQASRSHWTTAVVLLLLCGGGVLMVTPHGSLPETAAQCRDTVLGKASQAVGRLPTIVPCPSKSSQQQAGSRSWEAHSFQTPLQVWHQMALSPVPHVPSSLQLLHKAAHAAWFDPAPEASEGDALGPGRGSIHRMSEQLSWAGLQGLAGKLAARMPGLVATGVEPGPDRGEDAQVIDSWARHALSAPAACWQHAVRPLSSIPRLAGHILSKGAEWLLDGLQSVRDPAGLSSVKPGIEIDDAVMPGKEAGQQPAEPSPAPAHAASEKSQQEATVIAAEPEVREPVRQQAELAVSPAEPAATVEVPAAASPQPSQVQSEDAQPSAESAQVQNEPAVVPPEPAVELVEPTVALADLAEPAAVAAEVVSQPALSASKALSWPHAASAYSETASIEPIPVESESQGMPAAGERGKAVQGAQQRDTSGQQPEQPTATAEATEGDAVVEPTPLGQPSPPDSEAETHQQGLQALLPQDSDADTALSTHSSLSSTAQTSSSDLQPELHAAESADSEPGSEAPGPESSPLSRESRSKLQQLLSLLLDRHWFSQSSNVKSPVTLEPHTTRLGVEQPETQQLDSTGLAQQEHSQPTLTKDNKSARQDPSTDTRQAVAAVLPFDVSRSSEMFLWCAAWAVAAWLLSSLLLHCFASTSPHPQTHADDREGNALPEEEDRDVSPDVMHSALAEDTEATAVGAERASGLATRARSVARSMSEAVSGMMTSRSEMPGEEEGHEADSAPGGAGVSSVRSRRGRGRRELAALGDISEVEATPRRSRHAPERFTVDSYDGRSKDIRKYHRSETLVQNVDTLSLRNRTVLTPSPAEIAAASGSRELRSLKKKGA